MEKTEILARVDHTALKSTATWEDIRLLCEEAVEYKTASVCIPPSYLKRARAAFPQLNLCTVIGFPLGYSTTASKVFETKDAVTHGADEIDMVVNLGDVKNGNFEEVTAEIMAVPRTYWQRCENQSSRGNTHPRGDGSILPSRLQPYRMQCSHKGTMRQIKVVQGFLKCCEKCYL